MILPPTSSVNGAWVDKKVLNTGDVLKIVSEAKLEEGQNGQQLVAKVRVKGSTDEPKNVAINKPSRRALTEAFGEDTVKWIGQLLTAHTEKVMMAGKRGIALYLVPEGYEVGEDTGGYVVVQKIGGTTQSEDTYPTEDAIRAEDIPF